MAINQVDAAMQEVLETKEQTEVALGGSLPAVIFEIHQEIEIAAYGVEVATCGRAEELETLDAELATKRCDFLAMLFDERHHAPKYIG